MNFLRISGQRKVRKPLGIGIFGQIVAEAVGFEPTCRSPGKRFSRAPRYGHFGTPPSNEYMVCSGLMIRSTPENSVPYNHPSASNDSCFLRVTCRLSREHPETDRTWRPHMVESARKLPPEAVEKIARQKRIRRNAGDHLPVPGFDRVGKRLPALNSVFFEKRFDICFRFNDFIRDIGNEMAAVRQRNL